MTSEWKNLPDFPLLPLKNVVVFPRTVVHLTVGRAKSLIAIDESLAHDRRLVVVAQRNPDSDDILPDDLFAVGTLVEILKVNRQPDGACQVVVEGLRRVSLVRVAVGASSIRARAADLAERGDLTAPSLLRHLVEQFEQYARLARGTAAEVVETVKKADHAGPLADLVAAHLPLEFNAKQGILETLSHRERFERVAVALANEIEVQELDSQIRQRVRQQMDKNQREYYLKEQLKAIHEELGNDAHSEAREYLARIAEKGVPEAVAAKLSREVARLERMPSSSPEANVIRTYLDVVLSLPWSERSEDQLDIDYARDVLDNDHFGLEKVKERIVEFLAVRALIRQNGATESRGSIICFVGPPGVGKTSLGRSIARAMNRKFYRLSLGGVRDEAEIRGHRRTYVGALPGRILQAMRTVGVINPVILLDEVDKMTSDFRGDPAAALLEVLDPEQNAAFTDHYLEAPYDLSHVMFLTTANVLSDIPRPLRDRMEVIEVGGYTEEEKIVIGRDYLLPKQIALHGLPPTAITLSDRALARVVRHYTREAGVRGFERAIATICRKIATRTLRRSGGKTRLSPNEVSELLGPPRYQTRSLPKDPQIGVAIGLAWTENGGEILPVEVAMMPGRGGLTITGRLGDVMQESARAALSYVRSRAGGSIVAADFPEKWDLHIHVPEGAIPKDGPSAGVTIAAALMSLLTHRPLRNDIAMTGEVTLRGRVLAIGGLKEKALAAHRAGIREIIAPADNRPDIAEIPKKARDEMRVHFVATMDEILTLALTGPVERLVVGAPMAEAPLPLIPPPVVVDIGPMAGA